jgi:hypothetical protein
MEGFLIGGVSGCAATFLLYPLETIKTQAQIYGELTKTQTKISSFRIGYNLLCSHGAAPLYNGLRYSIARQMTYTSLRIGLYNHGTSVIQKTKYDTIPSKIGIGLTAGIISSLIAAPFDRLVVRYQAGKPQYIPDNIRQMRELWKGSSITVVRAGVINSVGLTVNNIMNQNSKNWIDRLTAGTTAGIIMATVSLPFDAMRTRILADNDTNKKYNGSFDCAKKIIKYEGFNGLYKGYPMYLGRVGTQSSIILFLSETLLSYLKK